MEHHRTVDPAETTPVPVSGTQAGPGPQGSDRDRVRAQDGDPMGGPAAGDGLWQRHDLLAAPARVAGGGRVATAARTAAGPLAGRRQNRLVTRGGRQCLATRLSRRKKGGPNPTDRRKTGSKHHVLTDARGLPLTARLTGANVNDVTELLALVDGVPPVRGKRGHPRRRPRALYADRGYDSDALRAQLRQRRMEPFLGRRRVAHGSGLGRVRWVVERTLAWLHQFRRLRTRYERRDDIHEAFLTLGCAIICWRHVKSSFC